MHQDKAQPYNKRFLEFIRLLALIGKDSRLFPRKCQTCGKDHKNLAGYLQHHKVGFLWGVLTICGICSFSAGIATAEGGDQSQELIKASLAGDLPKTERLLREGANVNARFKDGFTALMLASLTNHPAIVKLLLGKGADVNARTSHGVTALMLASGKGAIEVVRLLLESGADVNAKESSGWTALTHATKNGHEDLRALLIKHGAKE